MIALYQPKPEDLWFRQEMLSDESTMTYNHAWGGTIPFPKARWASWYAKWLGGDQDFFYRYLRDDRGVFVGETAYHYENARQVFLCDVIVYAKYRGKGYGKQGLLLLCEAAKGNGLSELYDDIAMDNPAISMFLRCGFTEVSRNDAYITVKKTLQGK